MIEISRTVALLEARPSSPSSSIPFIFFRQRRSNSRQPWNVERHFYPSLCILLPPLVLFHRDLKTQAAYPKKHSWILPTAPHRQPAIASSPVAAISPDSASSPDATILLAISPHILYAVLEVDDGVFEVLSTSGDTHLGGDDFNKRIVDWLAETFKRDEDCPKHIDTTLTRAKFEELCSDLLDRLKTPVETTLKDANLSLKDLDEVVLVGG
ncbi:unnamed protein product [Lactuca virosa]|uniref:Heat shock protein 70 n=1 Tax=Lactuca virosa TaxID=75947 RepID=A0AAU9MKW8_9ASTR|nr:unnamed protein product [Lactuca virosa]